MKHSILGAACAALLGAASGAAQAVSISGQGTWETTLQGRDLDGDLSTFEAYYDTALDITWLADANYAGTAMIWTTANTWAANLNPYGSGITGWRLPTISDTATSCFSEWGYSGFDCGYNVNTSSSEMAHMFYTTLGDKAYYDTSGAGPQDGYGLTNTGPFSNLQSTVYWSDTPGYWADYPEYIWSFDFSHGVQDFSYGYINYSSLYPAWAVHTGDVGALSAMVPVPTAAWLFGSGLLGLVGVSRKRRR